MRVVDSVANAKADRLGKQFTNFQDHPSVPNL